GGEGKFGGDLRAVVHGPPEKPPVALPLPPAGLSRETGHHGEVAMGYTSGPGAFVSETRKSGGISAAAPAAAAVVLPIVGSTNRPALLRIDAAGRLFLMA